MNNLSALDSCFTPASAHEGTAPARTSSCPSPPRASAPECAPFGNVLRADLGTRELDPTPPHAVFLLHEVETVSPLDLVRADPEQL